MNDGLAGEICADTVGVCGDGAGAFTGGEDFFVGALRGSAQGKQYRAAEKRVRGIFAKAREPASTAWDAIPTDPAIGPGLLQNPRTRFSAARYCLP